MRAAILVFVSFLSRAVPALAAEPLASSLSCMDANGVPATVVTTKSGKQVPIIYRKSDAFSASGWTPVRRCQEVSVRFQEYH